MNIYLQLTSQFNANRWRAILSGGQAVVLHRLACLWKEQEARALPFLDLVDLIETKKTNCEKDYAVIGALAAELSDIDQRFCYSRSARELIELAARYPDRAADLMGQRPVLRFVAQGREALESALDAERREMMHANESRLMRYMAAADAWAKIWPEVASEITGKPLAAAHQIIIQRADGVLPFNVSEK